MKNQAAFATNCAFSALTAQSARMRYHKHNATAPNSTITSAKQVRVTLLSCVPPVWPCAI